MRHPHVICPCPLSDETVAAIWPELSRRNEKPPISMAELAIDAIHAAEIRRSTTGTTSTELEAVRP